MEVSWGIIEMFVGYKQGCVLLDQLTADLTIVPKLVV